MFEGFECGALGVSSAMGPRAESLTLHQGCVQFAPPNVSLLVAEELSRRKWIEQMEIQKTVHRKQVELIAIFVAFVPEMQNHGRCNCSQAAKAIAISGPCI